MSCAGTAACGLVRVGLEIGNFIFILRKTGTFCVWLCLCPAEGVPASDLQAWPVGEEGGIT